MRSHEIFARMTPLQAEAFLTELSQDAPDVSQMALAAAAGAFKLRPAFLKRQPKAKQAEWMRKALARFMAGYDLSAGSFLLLVNIILLILGCLLEGSTILLVVIPIFIPTAKALGIDLVHFGVVVVVNIMIGLLTPPYGLLLFVLANMTKQPLWAIVKEAAPFILAAVAVLAVITIVPDSILWLPRLMGYKG